MEIKTFEKACKVLNVQPYDIYHDRYTPDEIAYKKLKVIAHAINNGWKPNWDDIYQRKWFPTFILSSGFGFVYSGCTCDYSITSFGSRLCFESREKSDYVATQFIELYEDLLVDVKREVKKLPVLRHFFWKVILRLKTDYQINKMTKKEFIKKWNVAFENKEQELEFAREMYFDLKTLTNKNLKK